jgi:hypothetical protein
VVTWCPSAASLRWRPTAPPSRSLLCCIANEARRVGGPGARGLWRGLEAGDLSARSWPHEAHPTNRSDQGVDERPRLTYHAAARRGAPPPFAFAWRSTLELCDCDDDQGGALQLGRRSEARGRPTRCQCARMDAWRIGDD